MLASFYQSCFNSNRYIFQNLVQVNAEHHYDYNHRFLHKSELYLFFAYTLRFCYLLFSIVLNPHKAVLSQYDFFEHLFIYFSTDKDYFFGVTFIMLTFNGFLLEHDLYFHKIDTVAWKLLYDRISDSQIFQKSLKSVEVQTKQYFLKLQQFTQLPAPTYFHFLPKFCFQKYIDWKVKLELYSNLEFIDQEKFGQHKSFYFPNVSAKLRIQVCLTLIMLEKINTFIIVMAC